MRRNLVHFVVGLGSFVLASSAPALAHPLGNFTINHLSKLTNISHKVSIRYIVDMAEIPSFSVIRAHVASGDVTASFLTEWNRENARDLVPQLQILADGVRVPCRLKHSVASARKGAGGLATLYWQADLEAALPSGVQHIMYRDTSFPDRLGWKNSILAPAKDSTNELRAYPDALIGSPPDVTQLEFTAQGVALPEHRDTPDGAAVSAARSNQLSDLLARGTSDLRLVVLTLVIAMGLGALHALEPGHGKTLLAVSLVGARATPKQAVIMATALTFAHTIGVLALGSIILVGAKFIVPEQIYPWITLLSGVVIAILAARSLARFFGLRQGKGASDHSHAGIEEASHARMHAKAFVGTAPLTFRGAVIAAMSGSIAPCPAALVVFLTALSLHQVLYGIIVILAFSFGLAGLLTGVGLAVVHGAVWFSRRPAFEQLTQYGPLLSALSIALIGSIMVAQGFTQSGIAAPGFLVAGLTGFAILSYALVPHTHTALAHSHELERT